MKAIVLCLVGAATAIVTLPPTAFPQSQVSASSVNGVLNPVYFTGADIGAQVNAAWGSGQGKTVRIPAGTYSFSTSIQHPGAGYMLQCDAGATLNYTGSSDAIIMPSTSGASLTGAGVDGEGGCLITGTSAAQSAVHVHTTDFATVKNLRISGFTNGYGVMITGARSAGLSGLSVRSNKTGIYIAGESGGSAPGGVRIYDSTIANNSLGIDSENTHCCVTNNATMILGNVIENNTQGGVTLNWEQGAIVEGNYFENSGTQLNIGKGSDNVLAVSVVHNYFTADTTAAQVISLGYGIGFHFEDNTEIGIPKTQVNASCFINETYGSLGGLSGVRGVGTNYPQTGVSEFCNHGSATTTP